MWQPASCSSCAALRRRARSWPELSDTGGTNTSANTSSGTLPRNGSSSFSSSPARFALRHHVGVLEHREGTVVGPVHDVLVGPFEIEGQDEGFAQPRVGELLAARVDEPALRARRRLVRQHFALHPSVTDRREIVARGPDARRELFAEQVVLAGEALEGDLAVAIVLVAEVVEVPLTARHREAGAPPILDALELDVAAGLEASDLVAARSERNFQRRFVERARLVVGAGEDRQRRQEQRHVARAFFGETDPHARIVDGLGTAEIAQELRDDRVPLLLQDVERERDVVRGQLAAVVEARLRAHEKRVGLPVRRGAHRARSQPIHRVRLVGRPHHERGERRVHADRPIALEDVGVERIEGQERAVEAAAGDRSATAGRPWGHDGST